MMVESFPENITVLLISQKLQHISKYIHILREAFYYQYLETV